MPSPTLERPKVSGGGQSEGQPSGQGRQDGGTHTHTHRYSHGVRQVTR